MNSPRTLVVGIGSPHGDDQIGWLVADRLAAIVQADDTEIRRAASPMNVFDWLDDVGRLVICDACHGLPRPGEVRRWSWPTSEIPSLAWSGTHDLSLPTVLTLAQRLGRLPETVVVWAIEGAKDGMTETLSTEVAAAIPELVTRIERELNDEVPLQDMACTNNH